MTERSLPDAFHQAPLIAHRGAHSLYGTSGVHTLPENSMAAFLRAQELNLPIELDLWMSSDEELVVFHDPTVTRLTGESGHVSRLPFKRLRELRLGGTKEGIPALREVLESFDGGIVIHIKQCGLELQLKKALESTPFADERIVVESFNPLLLRRLACVIPRIFRCLLCGNDSTPSPLLAVGNHLTAVKAIRKFLAFAAQANGFALNVDQLEKEEPFESRSSSNYLAWTAASNSELMRCLQLGVVPISDYVPRGIERIGRVNVERSYGYAPFAETEEHLVPAF